jgi:hypothetical protein
VSPHPGSVVLHKREFGKNLAGMRRRTQPISRRKHHGNEKVELRVDFQSAAHEETAGANLLCGLILTKQKSGDQEAAEYEEKVYASPPETRDEQRPLGVIAKNKNYGYSTQHVERRIAHYPIKR